METQRYMQTFEDVELFIDLKQFEGAASSPTFFLGKTVVDISFVLWWSSHFPEQCVLKSSFETHSKHEITVQ